MKQTIKQINKHYTMQQRHKRLYNTSVSNTILQNILYLMYLKSYFCCDPNSMRILCGWKIYGDKKGWKDPDPKDPGDGHPVGQAVHHDE